MAGRVAGARQGGGRQLGKTGRRRRGAGGDRETGGRSGVGHQSGAWFLGRMSLCGPAGGAGLLDFWAKIEIGTPEACFVVLFLFFSVKYIG